MSNSNKIETSPEKANPHLNDSSIKKSRRKNKDINIEIVEDDNDDEIKTTSMKQKTLTDFFSTNSKKKVIEKDGNNEEIKKNKESIEIKSNNTNKNESKENKLNDNDKSKNNSITFSTNNKGLDIFISPLGTWADQIKDYLLSPNMKHTYDFVEKEYSKNKCFPPKDQIFNAFKKTPWENLKVVIIGQDPYIKEGEAMGLCFSVNKGITVPPSLKKIYKAIIEEGLMNEAPKHGDLTKWAEQGVLLLNVTMTVQEKQSNSHLKASKWENFTDHVIQTIDKKKKGVVFLLWGGNAQKKKKLMTTNNNFIIENIHPSPLAATKGNFCAIKQFTKCNDYLEKNGLGKIDWSIPQ